MINTHADDDDEFVERGEGAATQWLAHSAAHAVDKFDLQPQRVISERVLRPRPYRSTRP